MSLLCALSGKVPAEPVFSPQGYIFDLLEISSHLAKSAVCPFTSAPLQPEQLRPVKRSLPHPRQGSILSLIEGEIYSVVSDRHSVNMEIVKTREELKLALLKVSAAEKICADLQNELIELRAQLPKPGNLLNLEISKIDDWEVLMSNLPQAAASVAAERRLKLKSRENLQFPGHLEISSFHSPHLSNLPGVIAISEVSGKIVSAGKDGRLVFFDSSDAVSTVCSHPGLSAFSCEASLSITGSSDGSVRLWLEEEELASFHIFNSPIKTAVLSAATPEIAAVGVGEKVHCVDLERQMSRGVLDGFGDMCIFHPDGRLVIRQGRDLEIYSFNDRKMQGFLPVQAENFVASENGVNLATADSAAVKIWDLRKPNFAICEIEISMNCMVFDSTRGKNIFIAEEEGGRIYEYSGAALEERATVAGSGVQAARFTADGRALVTGTKRYINFSRV